MAAWPETTVTKHWLLLRIFSELDGGYFIAGNSPGAFVLHDIVWAKYGRGPFWPAQVTVKIAARPLRSMHAWKSLLVICHFWPLLFECLLYIWLQQQKRSRFLKLHCILQLQYLVHCLYPMPVERDCAEQASPQIQRIDRKKRQKRYCLKFLSDPCHTL